MKRRMRLVVGVVGTAIVLVLFLLPVIPMTVTYIPCKLFADILLPESASASATYAYLGIGMVYVPNPYPSH